MKDTSPGRFRRHRWPSSGRRFCLPPSGMCWILQSALPLRGFWFRETIYSLLWKGSNLTFRLHLVILSCVLFIYTSIAIGQLVPAHRIIVSIAVYFILNLITQIISIGVSIITSVFPDYVFSPAQTSFSEYFFQMLLIGTCATTVLAIAGYFITYRILQRNVNLI